MGPRPSASQSQTVYFTLTKNTDHAKKKSAYACTVYLNVVTLAYVLSLYACEKHGYSCLNLT